MNTFEDIQREAEALAAKSEAHIQELEAQRAELWNQIVQLRAHARRVAPPQRAKRPSKTTTSKATANGKSKWGPSKRSLQVAAAVLGENPEGAFSTKSLASSTGLDSTTTRRVIEELRAREVIRAAEKIRVNKGGHPTQLYRVMDESRLNELVETT